MSAPPLAPPHVRPAGVRFPLVDGRRSTTATGRRVLADAAAAVDAGLAARITSSARWRREYVGCFHDLTAAGAASPAAALAAASAGIGSLRSRMVVGDDGAERPVAEGLDGVRAEALDTAVVEGTTAPVGELRVPYGERELSGSELLDQLAAWVAAGVVEPSFAAALGRVVAHPEWLALPGRRVALVGAGAELSPVASLLAWGADVLAVDLPGAERWDRLRAVAAAGAGRLAHPVGPDGDAGADVVEELGAVHGWILGHAGDEPLLLGMHGYAHGGDHVRLTAAVDVLATALLEEDPRTALAYLGTPTDAYLVGEDVVEAARAAWRGRGARRFAQAPVRLAARGRAFAPAYREGVPVADVLIPQQGPNYALAKRAQRWRGMLAEDAGHRVSFNVAPATWTRSVTSNAMLARAYAGARHFGVEIFAPETTRALMAALLVHDLHAPQVRRTHPEELLAEGAAHGGLWRAAYEPRSVLPFAALLGLRGRSGRGPAA